MTAPDAAPFKVRLSLILMGKVRLAHPVQAIMAALQPEVQQAATQAQLRQLAAQHCTAGARFASFAGRLDLVEAAVHQLWAIVQPWASAANLRKAVVGHLEAAGGLLCSAKSSDPAFQVRVVS